MVRPLKPVYLRYRILEVDPEAGPEASPGQIQDQIQDPDPGPVSQISDPSDPSISDLSIFLD